MTKIKNGDNVSVHYTGRLEDGSVFDTSLAEGREPLTVTLGQGQLIPGFENGLIDMTTGEIKTIEIEPQNAYGEINSHQYILSKEAEYLGVDINQDNVQALIDEITSCIVVVPCT